MQKQSNNSQDDHDLPRRDEVTKNKIDRHLSDEKDTISEDDIKNINTSINTGSAIENEKRESDLNDFPEKKNEDDEPEKEMPTSWNIID
jgi:hypothetical protein